MQCSAGLRTYLPEPLWRLPASSHQTGNRRRSRFLLPCMFIVLTLPLACGTFFPAQSTVASMLGTVTIRFVGMILVVRFVLLLTVLALIHILCTGSKHVQCSQKCSKALLCGHECGQPCHGGSTCPPCQRACTAQCVHGQCRGWCTDLCAPCAEPCIWQCEHKVRLPFANMAHASSEPHNNSCMPCHRRCAVKHLITMQN